MRCDEKGLSIRSQEGKQQRHPASRKPRNAQYLYQLGNLSNRAVKKFLYMRLDALPIYSSPDDDIQVPSVDKQNEPVVLRRNSPNVLIVDFLLLLSSVGNHNKLATCVSHVIRRLLKIIRRQIRIVLALPNNLYGSILMPHQLPETIGSVIRSYPITNDSVVGVFVPEVF